MNRHTRTRRMAFLSSFRVIPIVALVALGMWPRTAISEECKPTSSQDFTEQVAHHGLVLIGDLVEAETTSARIGAAIRTAANLLPVVYNYYRCGNDGQPGTTYVAIRTATNPSASSPDNSDCSLSARNGLDAYVSCTSRGLARAGGLSDTGDLAAAHAATLAAAQRLLRSAEPTRGNPYPECHFDVINLTCYSISVWVNGDSMLLKAGDELPIDASSNPATIVQPIAYLSSGGSVIWPANDCTTRAVAMRLRLPADAPPCPNAGADLGTADRTSPISQLTTRPITRSDGGVPSSAVAPVGAMALDKLRRLRLN